MFVAEEWISRATYARPAAYWEQRFAVFVLFAFGTGVIAHSVPAIYPYTRSITDALLLTVNAALLWVVYHRQGDSRLFPWAAVTALSTFFIEVSGVATGQIFGVYSYGTTLQWQWLGVPVVIALNWTLLILAANALATRWLQHTWAVALAAALIIVGLDLLIEPVAMRLDYWHWAGGTIPVQNYVAWGLIGFVFSLILHRLQVRFYSVALLAYLLAQFIFFGGLWLFLL